MTWWERVLQNPDTPPMVVVVAAFLVFGAIVITKLLIRHRERMAMIEQGMDPDAFRRDALKRVFSPGE
jgi:hypothetical protein